MEKPLQKLREDCGKSELSEEHKLGEKIENRDSQRSSAIGRRVLGSVLIWSRQLLTPEVSMVTTVGMPSEEFENGRTSDPKKDEEEQLGIQGLKYPLLVKRLACMVISGVAATVNIDILQPANLSHSNDFREKEIGEERVISFHGAGLSVSPGISFSEIAAASGNPEKDSSITVAFDDIPENCLNSPLRLEKVANEVIYRRMKDALIQLSKGVQKGPAADLIPVLFGERSPTVTKKDVKFTPFNSNLDHSQMPFQKPCHQRMYFWLHGPPGTGKTTKVVEIILQEVKCGSKILERAASNIAVNNIVERLVPHRFLRGDNSALASDIRKEMKVQTHSRFEGNFNAQKLSTIAVSIIQK
ncbi:uncharacterized protein LOC132162222 [Corylus avellana]|uniref:uncharacterized protein LOC132162222 n=1 Tax=Corylus avellana TaxID=13451 RepID=UPI00286D288E|nr:uncharacterized protein LOC132162222 [Corylus avellana]